MYLLYVSDRFLKYFKRTLNIMLYLLLIRFFFFLIPEIQTCMYIFIYLFIYLYHMKQIHKKPILNIYKSKISVTT